MPGRVPGIHAFRHSGKKDVDGRVKPGHDAKSVERRLMVERRRFGNILPQLVLWIGIGIVAFPVYLAFNA